MFVDFGCEYELICFNASLQKSDVGDVFERDVVDDAKHVQRPQTFVYGLRCKLGALGQQQFLYGHEVGKEAVVGAEQTLEHGIAFC